MTAMSKSRVGSKALLSARGEDRMTKALSDQQIEQYYRDGCLFPLSAISPSEVAKLRAKLAELEQREGGKISARTNRKPHLLLPWLNEVIRHPRILDAVEDVIGPNILCWGSGFFAKAVNDRALVSWHQDSTYWGLSEPEVVTAWGRILSEHSRERLHADHPREPQARSDPASRHLCRKQPLEPGSGDRGRGRRGPRRRRDPRARPNVTAPCSTDPRLGAEPG